MTDRRNLWLAVVAVIALGLGVVALIVGLNAKSTSDDAATQAELTKVKRQAAVSTSAQRRQEQGVKRAQRQQGRKQAQQQAQVSAQSKHERAQAAEIAQLDKKVAVLRQQSARLTDEVDNLKAKVNNLAVKKKNK